MNCALAGRRANVVGVPTDCTLEADQAGDATYAPAPPVTRRYSVDWQHVNVTYLGPTATPSLAAGSVTVRVQYASTADIGLGGVEVDSQTADVCDSGDAEAPAAGGNRYVMMVALVVHQTGQCVISVNAGSSQFALSYPEMQVHFFTVGP